MDLKLDPEELHLMTSYNAVFKISIYSKVTGCRVASLSDHTIVKQLRVVILQHLVDGNPEHIPYYRFAYEKLKNGGVQVVSGEKKLIAALGGLRCFAGIPCKMTFPDTPRVVGFLRDLPMDLEPSELKEQVRRMYPEVYSVRYVTEKMLGNQRKSPCAFVSFNLHLLPEHVMLYGRKFEIHVPNPMQCTRCGRYGHQAKQCRAPPRCTFCAEDHYRSVCQAYRPKCVNCHGQHVSSSRSCPVWQQGKLMNELRYRGGCTAENAMNIATNGNVLRKQHVFVSDDYFDKQEDYFFGLDTSDDSYDNTSPNISLMDLSNISTIEDDDPQELVTPPRTGNGCHPMYLEVTRFLDLMSAFYVNSTAAARGFPLPIYPSSLEPQQPKKPSEAAEQLKAIVNESTLPCVEELICA